jgi:hypothetical protein
MYYVLSTSLLSLTLSSTTNHLRLVATCSTHTIVSSRVSCAGLQKSYLPMQFVKVPPQAPLALLACTTNSAHSRLQMVEKLYCGAAPHEGCELRVVVYRFVGLACSIKSIANINIIVDYWTIGIRQDMRLRNSRPCATTSARVWETWYSLHLPSFLAASKGIPPGQAYYTSRLYNSWSSRTENIGFWIVFPSPV